MSKHTPGPWTLREDIGAVFGRDGLPIATGGCESDEEYIANGRLIAAAPDLLKALRVCRAELAQNMAANEPGGAMDRALQKAIVMAINAIEKAEGK